MSRRRVNPPVPSKRKTNKVCDGTAADYRRHVYRGEPICAASREAWRIQHRYYYYTGLYETKDPETAHPFMYRKSKPIKRDRGGVYHDSRNKSKNSKDPRNGK